jgi:acyl-CoA thioesterase-2
VCATFASYMTLLDSTLLKHGLAWGTGGVDRREPGPCDVVPPTVPRRLVVALRTGVAVGGAARGLAHGSIYTRDGKLVASVVQEGLLRAATR